MARMTTAEALETVRLWHACGIEDCCDGSPACALAAEVEQLRAVVDELLIPLGTQLVHHEQRAQDLRARVAELEAQIRHDGEIMRELGADARTAEQETYEAWYAARAVNALAYGAE